MSLYKFIKHASVWVRGLLFEQMIEQLHISDNIIVNYLISFLASYMIHAISFFVVGLFYTRGEDPATGSVMYFVAWVNYTFWIWLGLKCYIGAMGAGPFVSTLLYFAIGAIVVANIVGVVLLKKVKGEHDR